MKKIVEQVKDLCFRNNNSILVRVLPTGFVLSVRWNGWDYLMDGSYVGFVAYVLFGCLIAMLLIFLPDAFLNGWNDERKHSNLEVLFGEIVVIACIVMYYLEHNSR